MAGATPEQMEAAAAAELARWREDEAQYSDPRNTAGRIVTGA